jgi:hypothetical protein
MHFSGKGASGKTDMLLQLTRERTSLVMIDRDDHPSVNRRASDRDLTGRSSSRVCGDANRVAADRHCTRIRTASRTGRGLTNSQKGKVFAKTAGRS